MKILKKATKDPTAPWWAGIVLCCDKCGIKIKLTEEDKPDYHKTQFGVEFRGVICPTPNCNRLLFV